jgi:hypothetical protein
MRAGFGPSLTFLEDGMGKTLKELNAQVGDIVLFDGVKEYRVLEGKRIQSVGRDDSPDGVDYAPYWDKAMWFEMVSKAEPVVWKDMSDAEKGKLLLAHHNGLAIEYYVDGWAVDNEFDPAEFSDIAYRVAEVKPVVTSVWFNVYPYGPSRADNSTRKSADENCSPHRIAVMRIDTCNGVLTAHLEDI